MKPGILAKLKKIQERVKEIETLLRSSSVISDQEFFRVLIKEHAQLSIILRCFKHWCNVQKAIHTNECFLHDPEMQCIAQDELQLLRMKLKTLEQELIALLLPKNSEDNFGCFIEIRAGTGGNEAALFASALFRMYSRFAEISNWKIEVISINSSEQGGFKEVVAKIPNKGAYNILKFESGGHRVQRVPETESQGRIHTSVCTVVVMPDIPEKELPKINFSDLRIDSFRSSGAGGQHVNTTDSAIRITHLPTGLVAECQDERSQHKNKAKALAVLTARLHANEIQRRQQETSNTRKSILKSGDRSERIRTYNFIQGRVTDHRINLSLYQLEEILEEGKLNIIIQPVMQKYYNNQLVMLSES